MHGEQSPKTICEICGGTHPTTLHADTSVNIPEQERGREEEPNHEAMKKVVDFFATEDLKYRNDPILPTLETGVPTPITGFLYEPFGRLDETTREKMQEEAEILEKARKAGKEGYDAYGNRRQKANVFYPEGLLKALHDKILGTKTVELWSEEDFEDAGKYFAGSGMTSFCIQNFACAYEFLTKQERNIIAQAIGISTQKVSIRMSRLRSGLDDYGPVDVEDEDKKKMREILEAVFSNVEAFEIMRKAWLKMFFANAQKKNMGALTNIHYVPISGLVLSPDTKVAVSPHGDYPTQATALSPRIKPKEIIGLFVNSSPHENEKQRYEYSIFHTPQQPIEYLFANFPRPFILFLENQGFQRIELKNIFGSFSSFYKKDYMNSLLQENEGTKNVAEKLRTAIEPEIYDRLEALARKFIEENSPVKDGETLWTGLLRLAERHQLPVYNLDGELIWPKHMTHKQVAQYVAEKSEKE